MSESNGHAHGNGLAGVLLRNPATEHLMQEVKSLLAAEGQKAVRQVGERLGSATEGLGPAAEGVKKLAAGESPGKAMTSTALSALKQKAKNALGGGGAGKAGSTKDPGPPKVTHIMEAVDVGVPVSTAYDQWTQFQEFPKFMKGVESVDPKSETEQNWRVKVFKSRRTWQGKTLEQIPDRRITWTTEGAKGTTKGTVTFHPLADDLTRVALTMEYYSSGFMEKIGNLWRAGGRRTRLDLKHFGRFITIKGEASGSWRGEIRDGAVVRQPGEEDQDAEPREAEAQETDTGGSEEREATAPKAENRKPAGQEAKDQETEDQAPEDREPDERETEAQEAGEEPDRGEAYATDEEAGEGTEVPEPARA
ncbi:MULTISPECIES: SRPBCC family protein [Pseudofrankia]|uniref:SRPBCC family protein n=1 Tax=Pseudofrankia TaxID=2994363 RepID=UPI000234D2C0|nr:MULTISPECIES: SRPBCC family protein [Pseudofrankia]OHV34189.1 cyclase [Pseudofrankia sp. EUN1h]